MPKLLKLVSLEVIDLQEGDAWFELDELRLVILLDGRPVRTVALQVSAVEELNPYVFTASDNLTQQNMAGAVQPFVYWSLADVTFYEVDTEGLTTVKDTDVDEWIQNVRLDHRDTLTLEVGKDSEQHTYLLPGRSDCQYRLTYSIQDQPVLPDDDFFRRIDAAKPASEFLNDGKTNGDLDADKGDCKWICAIDGGGLRGIFPLRMLEQLEDYYQRTCFDIFDMFAGTSTGSMISAALASGRPLKDVIALYSDDITRGQIFAPNHSGQRHAFRFMDLKRLSPSGQNVATLDNAFSAAYLSDVIESQTGPLNRMIDAAARQAMTPRYQKTGMKNALYQMLSERTNGSLKPLTLGELRKDILITARDLHRHETTVFAAFHCPYEEPVEPVLAPTNPRLDIDDLMDGEPYPITKLIDVVTGHYQNLLLKDVVEASSSAPVYFAPRGRFTDGGIGPYNNPSFIAAFEALRNSNVDLSQEARTLEPKYTPYAEKDGVKSGTVVWSLGTAHSHNLPDANTAHVVGGSLSLNGRTDTVLYWLTEVVDNLMFGSSQEQVFLCKEVLRDQIKYIRIDLGLNNASLNHLSADAGSGDYDQMLASIRLDAYPRRDFDNMDQVAQRFALEARNAGFGFDSGGYEYPDPSLDDAGKATYATWVEEELRNFE